MDGGNVKLSVAISDYIAENGRLQEDEARRFFHQIIYGVDKIHKKNMVAYLDLKPENLHLDSERNVKIATLVNIMGDGHFLNTSYGNPYHIAPEVLSGKLDAVGPKVDIWSCGVILYFLLCGKVPFDDENVPNLIKKIKGGIFSLPSHLSDEARDLIARMLLVNYRRRVTISQICQHQWFKVQLTPQYLDYALANVNFDKSRGR